MPLITPPETRTYFILTVLYSIQGQTRRWQSCQAGRGKNQRLDWWWMALYWHHATTARRTLILNGKDYCAASSMEVVLLLSFSTLYRWQSVNRVHEWA